MTGYLCMALLALLAMALLTRPWWGRAQSGRLARRAANISAYRTRLAEIDADAAAGVLAPEAVIATQEELAARLLADTQPDPIVLPSTVQRLGTRSLPVLLALLIPAAAAVWYGQSDSWRAQRDIAEVTAHPEQAQALIVESMVRRLEQRLRKSPGDADGWAMLGRSYFVMHRNADAVRAYHQASELSGSRNADWLVGEGEAMGLLRGHDLRGEPAQLFEAALKLDPDNVKALWYAGFSAVEVRQYAQAQTYWLRLRALNSLPPELADALENRLQELSKLSGLPLPAKKETNVAEGTQLQLLVSAAPQFAGRLPKDATLFVYAKAQDGPPMPLAVRRFAPGQWSLQAPLAVTLDDSMAMMPAMKLSAFDRWTVIARISRSGSVQPQSGDLQGTLQLDKGDTVQAVRLVIDQFVR